MNKPKPRRAQRQPEPEPQLTEEQTKAARRAYQHDYYLKHKDKAKTYQRDYHKKYRKRSNGTGAKSLRGSLRKEADREAVRSVHNANSLQAIPIGGKLERELNRILSGKCDYAGTR